MTTFVRKHAAVIAAVAMLSLLAAAPAAGAGLGADQGWSHRDVHICAPGVTDQAACTSMARVFYQNGLEYHAATPAQLAAAARSAASVSFTAAEIRTAYGITGVGDPSKVIAIVDAYDNPDALSHLTAYRSDMGLPSIQSCTLTQLTGLSSSTTTPCFANVNQTGGTTMPSANAGWATEIDLDLQAASAICPKCSLLLLEANSSSFGDLGTAVTTASNQGHVVAISNSYGTTRDVSGATYPAWDQAAQKGIAVMASSGDWGYKISFPASATNVIGVGGTTLSVSSTTRVRTAETVWPDAGSGCSTYNAAPSWQVIPNSPCGSRKAVADLSAVADPYSGLEIYTTYNNTTGWWIFGGTSLSSPIIAALYAMQGGYGGSYLAGNYAWASTTQYYDVTSGSNGRCRPSVLCTAGDGWDGPTGLGSIAAPVASTAPTITSADYATFTVGVGGSFTVITTGTPTPTLSETGDLPSGVTFTDNGDGTATLAGTPGAGTAGSYSFTITAANEVGTDATQSFTLTVSPAPAGDFSLSASPAARSIKAGQSTSYAITITRLNGFDGGVSFSVSGLPSGTQSSFSPATTTDTTSTLSIETPSSTARGTYTLTITGTSGTVERSASVTLKIR